MVITKFNQLLKDKCPDVAVGNSLSEYSMIHHSTGTAIIKYTGRCYRMDMFDERSKHLQTYKFDNAVPVVEVYSAFLNHYQPPAIS